MGLQYDFVKILDFGLVKQNGNHPDASQMTLDGTATGTPAYLAPEVALGENNIDGRADLYSLGCVAYFLLTGQMVFQENTPTALALAHVSKTPIPVTERTELRIPAGLAEIVMKLLEKRPEDRIRSAQELDRRLRSLVDVPSWCPDAAADWWQTNLPESVLATPVKFEDSTPTSAELASPVGMRHLS